MICIFYYSANQMVDLIRFNRQILHAWDRVLHATSDCQ